MTQYVVLIRVCRRSLYINQFNGVLVEINPFRLNMLVTVLGSLVKYVR
jgi:hypothetical protein